MKKTLCRLACLLSLTTGLAQASEQSASPKSDRKIALTGATVVSPHLASAIDNAVVMIEGDRIMSVGPASTPIGPDYTEIDLAGQWVVPGYIDSHVHFFQSGSVFTRPDSFDYRAVQPYDEDRAWVHANLEDTLARYVRSGITGVVDMCGPNWTLDLRSMADELPMSPSIAAAGACIGTITAPALETGDGDPVFVQVSSAQQAVSAVASLLKREPDLLKVMWVPDQGESPDHLYDLFRDAIALARSKGVPVAVHALELANAKQAIRAGADILVHGVMFEEVDDEFVRLAREHDVIYMPTLAVHASQQQVAEHGVEFSEHEKLLTHPDVISSFETAFGRVQEAGMMVQMFRKYVPMVDSSEAELEVLTDQERSIIGQLRGFFSKEVTRVQRANLRRMHEEGVTLALGTDAGNPGVFHGAALQREIEAWHESGLPPAAILKALTINNARVMGREHETGSVETGKLADLVVLGANPKESVANFGRINLVIRRGNLIRFGDSY